MRGDFLVTKKELQKNKIDLEFKAESQEANIFLTLLTITFIGFITAMFIKGDYVAGGVVGFFIFVIALVQYTKRKRKMRDLLNKIDEI